MHFVLLRNVAFPFGKEFTRVTLARILASIGHVEEIMVNAAGRMASLCFADAADAQEALLALDGFVLFGTTVTASVSEAIASGVDGYMATLSPSRRLLVKNAPYLSVLVSLRHVAGVKAIVSISLNACAVDVNNDETAEFVKASLTHHCNRWQEPVSVLYLRRSS